MIFLPIVLSFYLVQVELPAIFAEPPGGAVEQTPPPPPPPPPKREK